jgi:hypothetical protein
MKKVFLIIFLGIFLSQCNWFKKKDPAPTDPIAQLPPITQEGKNTFGCLVNEEAFVPKGQPNMFTSNFDVVIDPNNLGGTIGITGIRYIRDKEWRVIDVGIDSVKKYGINKYKIHCKVISANTFGGGAYFYDYQLGKEYLCGYNATILNASLNLTRYDLQSGIVSGTFEFTLAKPNDTIKVTNGRFDKKLN